VTDDSVLGGNLYAPHGLCPEVTPMPAFGTAVGVIVNSYIALLGMLLESVTSFIACINFDIKNPAVAIQKLFVVNTRQAFSTAC